MPGTLDELSGIDLSEVREEVGSRSFQRGRDYARGQRVAGLDWEPVEMALRGTVIGTAPYVTTVYFAEADGGGLGFDFGECTCPVGYNCKHVAAVAIAVADRGAGAPSARGAPRAQPPAPAVPAWERSLRGLIDAPTAAGGERPLAIELSLNPAGPRPRLMARLMRPGARGGWVNGQLSWGGLDSWSVREGGYRSDHLALAEELHAIHRAQERRPSYYYGYGDGGERSLDLSDCDSPRLWDLLDEAARIDLSLIHAQAGLGGLAPHAEGELVLDVGRDGDRGSVVGAVLRLGDDAPAGLDPLLFLGASGHGIVCAERDDGSGAPGDLDRQRRLRLVRLARSAPAELQRMLLEDARLEIPADELDRFVTDIYPALRHVATVASADGSFTPPEISAPSLVLEASYGDGHSLELGWAWNYEIDSRARRVPLGTGASAAGFRDRRAERAILAEASLAGTGLERLGLLDAASRPAKTPPAALTGVETMRATTEVLPGLPEHGVEVEVVGEPADYRDVGDSLTIGVSTAESGEGDWFDLGVTISVEGRELPFAEVFGALAAGEERLLLDDGAHLSLGDSRLESLRQLIAEARELADSPSAPLRISRYQAGLWAELAALGVVTEQAEAWRRQAGALLELEEVSGHDPPAAVEAELRPYQLEGFGWLASLWELGLGGILADDMGLGKTLQTLAMVAHARERDPAVGPFLIVAPTSVVPNWVGEAARFAPGLTVGAVTDTLRKSGRSIHELASADVVVTTYTLFRLDAEAYREVEWAGLILDEAQTVKNYQSKTYKCVRELAAPYKLALTGTPMENNLTELWSLLSITAPGLFPDPKRFAEQYARPIERERDGERLARLRRRIKPLVKRRTKELVAADLPPKQEGTLEVDLHARHRKLYETRLQRERQKILGLLDDFDRNRFTILRSITLLRQLSIDPSLVEEGNDDIPCAKLATLVEQLGEVVGGGHRALVFSQFTGFLARVRDRLDREGIDYCYLDGSTRNRDRVIERFKGGTVPVFLISLKAGGFGLNLTEADYCFLLDPWWNPATETQAIDRVHRIGQTRPVIAYRMIARETIEEKVVALARRKAELFSGVMDDGELFAGQVTADDIRGLLDEPAPEARVQADEALAGAA